MSWWDQVVTAASNTFGASGATTAPAGSGGGFDWGDALNIGAQVLGPALTAAIANQGANAQSDAVTGANQAAINLQRDIYQDQVGRSEPWRQSGLNALNFMNQWNGLPQVTDTRVSMSGGSPLLPNLGAGQPVVGHSGGGGSSQLGQAAGSVAGSTIGNMILPGIGGAIGGSLGGALGGVFRNGGDNWTTVATQAPGGYDYEAYMKSPGLEAEWAKPDVQALFGGNRDAYAYWHANGGNLNGKQSWAPNMEYLKEVTSKNPQFANSKTTQPIGGAQQVGGAAGGSAPDLWSTIRNNPLYVAAQDGFLGVNGQGGDVSQIKGAFANGGQLLSGSTLKALQDRSVSRSYGALSDIYGGYSELAGVGSRTASEQNQNAGTFGVNAGNLTSQNGQIAGQAAATKNANWAQAGQTALSGIYDMGKSKGWF